MCKLLDSLKEEYNLLTNGGEENPKLETMAVFVALVICTARFVHDFIKRITKR